MRHSIRGPAISTLERLGGIQPSPPEVTPSEAWNEYQCPDTLLLHLASRTSVTVLLKLHLLGVLYLTCELEDAVFQAQPS